MLIDNCIYFVGTQRTALLEELCSVRISRWKTGSYSLGMNGNRNNSTMAIVKATKTLGQKQN